MGRAGRVLLASVLTGVLAAVIVQSWLEVVEGDWVANAAVLSLTVLAIGAALAGLYAVIGKAGLLIGALLMIFVGNPFSAVSSAPELLPQPAGAIGQLMPPGAGANLLRSTGFFDGAGASTHLMVLAARSLAGLALLAAAALRRRRRAAPPRGGHATPTGPRPGPATSEGDDARRLGPRAGEGDHRRPCVGRLDYTSNAPTRKDSDAKPRVDLVPRPAIDAGAPRSRSKPLSVRAKASLMQPGAPQHLVLPPRFPRRWWRSAVLGLAGRFRFRRTPTTAASAPEQAPSPK